MDQQQSQDFSTIRSSATDGRAHNAFFRRTQLKRLHLSLVKNASAIQQCMREDKTLTLSDIKIEYCLALRCVVDAHDSVDPARAIEDEYAIARGVDQSDARRPVGIVVIEPSSSQALVHSLITALTAALAAGNCVIVQCFDSLRSLPRLLLKTVGEALDNDIFMVYTKPVIASELNHPHVRVVQNCSGPVKAESNCLVSANQTSVIALVERDAQVEEAAKALVFARLTRGGTSPYAPDVVLVNEWVKQPFLDAAIRQQVGYGAVTGKDGTQYPDLTKDTQLGNISLISSGPSGKIIDVHNRSSTILTHKVQSPCLIIHAVKSIDDAIDVSKMIGQSAAAYVFASPPAAKYFCQFVESSISLINHVPIKLMYGPLAPVGSSPHGIGCDIYTQEMFTVLQPRFVSVSSFNKRLRNIVDHHTTTETSVDLLIAEASAELSDVKRPSHVSPLGFFEQGIITGLVVTLTAIVGGMGISGYFLHKFLYSW